MKIAILTRTSATNFGTVLQAYALQKYLKIQGHAVKTVDDTLARRVYSKVIKVESKKTFKERVVLFIDGIIEKIKYSRALKLERASRAFKAKHIDYFYANDIADVNNSFDVFIAGSDQIWAYAAEPELFPFFLLETISNEKIKASYAVSIGESQFPLEHKEKVSYLLNRFDYLSVREKSSREVVGEYTENPISVSCDPVFLINNEDWQLLSGKRKIKNKYIFCYFLGDQEWYWEKVSLIAETLGCEVYIYQQRETKHKYHAIHVCSPTEFLNYVEFAEFVLTDSFHGLCFSLIFERQFCVLQRFKESNNNIQNSRLIDLLNMINLPNKFWSENFSCINESINYQEVKEKIDVLKNESKQYLKKIVQRGTNGDEDERKTKI